MEKAISAQNQKKDFLSNEEATEARKLKKEGRRIRPVWFKDNILFTLFLNASSICIPDAERFVVDTVREALERGVLSVPRKEVEKLIEEEIAHSMVHDAYNGYLRRTGLPIDAHLAREQKIIRNLGKRFSLKTRLAFCTITEHFTASMSKQILDTGILEGRDIDPRMDRVWVWHALEELDHRSTAFDIYLAAGGGYVRRLIAGIYISVVFLYIQHRCLFSVLRQKRILWNGRVWRKGLPYLFGQKGVYRNLMGSWVRYFVPGFHPSSIPVSNNIKRQLHHYPIESELIEYFNDSHGLTSENLSSDPYGVSWSWY